MASQPNNEINVEPQSQPQNQTEQLEVRRPQTQQIEPPVNQIPRTASSHSQTSYRSNQLSPGPRESRVPPSRPPAVVSFPHFRDTSAATLGLAERLDPDIPFQTNNPADGRMSRRSTLRTPIGEYENGRRNASDNRRSTPVASDEDIYMYPNTVYKCLMRTFKHAKEEREKAKLTARTAKWSMLAVAGAQVLLGALTTGLSALRLDGQKSAAATTALGILSTLSGSYLAHIRATSEPEKSIMRIHKLDAFIRRLDAFLLDHAYDPIDNHKSEIENYRHEFEVILAEASPLNTSTRPSAMTSSAMEDKMKLKQKENV